MSTGKRCANVHDEIQRLWEKVGELISQQQVDPYRVVQALDSIMQDESVLSVLGEGLIRKSVVDAALTQFLLVPVGELGLSVRTRKVVHRLNAQNLGQLAQLTHNDFEWVRQCGKVTKAEIAIILQSYGLSLGTRLPESVLAKVGKPNPRDSV